MGLCSGFVTTALWITQGCVSYCWMVLAQVHGLFCSSPCPASEWLGMHKELGRDATGTVDSNWPKGYIRPCGIILSNKRWGKKEGGTHSGWWCLSSLSHCYMWWSLAVLGMPEHCLPMESAEWIPYFALLAHAAFTFSVKHPLSQPMSLYTFTLWFSPLPTGGMWVSSCLGLSCPPG